MAKKQGIRHELCVYCKAQHSQERIIIDETENIHQYVTTGFCDAYCEARHNQEQKKEAEQSI